MVSKIRFMSIRTFLFCDVCNPRGVRIPEQRRDMQHRNTQGRRVTDGRSWFEGDLKSAVNDNDWVSMDGGYYVCPICSAKGLHADNMKRKSDPGLRSFIFCDSCNPQGIRTVEIRRNEERGAQTGRRITDGRAWLAEIDPDKILAKNWLITDTGRHYCPKCVKLHPSLSLEVS